MNFKTVLTYLNYKLTAYTEHDLHSPFLYNFYTELIKNEYPFDDFETLHTIRLNLLSNPQNIEVTDLGAGSRKLDSAKRPVAQIARHGIAQKKQAEFLYRLVNRFAPKTIIELGTSVGLTTLYLSAPLKNSRVYTIEGCGNLHRFSAQLFKQHQVKNIQAIHGNFNDQLPALLESLDSVDLLYIDGNHAYEPTMHYFHLALAKKNPSTIMVFDDIYWSEGMEKAWKEICAHKDVTLSLDLFHFGIIFFRTEQKNKEHFVLKF